MRFRLPLLLILTGLVSAPAHAQDRDEVGLAIAQWCGMVEEERVGVLAGTVTDEQSGVPLDGAAVIMRWSVEGEEYPRSDAVRTSSEGFFLFCGAPGGHEIELWAEILDRRSETSELDVEAGTLLAEHLKVAVSDPSQPGFVTGRVVDVQTRLGVVNAEVRVRDMDITTLTNDRGLFVLAEMPYGIYVVEVDHIAYASRELPLRVAGGLTQNVEVEMSEEAMEIEGLTVSVEPRRFHSVMEGLVHRMDMGFGDFLTRNEIDMRGASTLGQLLVGLPGVRLAEGGRSLVIRGRGCVPMVFMDGRRYVLDDELGLNEIYAFDLEAVEFYKGTAGIPAEFNYNTNGQAGCGAVVVWTRRGR